MFNSFGLSVYVTTFKKQIPLLEKLKGKNIGIFTSLHIGEEVTDTYVKDVENMCHWLNENGFYIIADVSPLTLERFGEKTLASLVKRLHLNNLRLDFGFDNQSLGEDLDEVDITYNASTVFGEDNRQKNTYYMHNFYPRPETGLDSEQFEKLNGEIKENDGNILAFISGDTGKRGPIFEGLPTLETHRQLAPYTQYIDLIKGYQMDAVYVGDILISDYQLDLILSYLKNGTIKLPVVLSKEHEELYNKPMTVRIDSPKGLFRIQESREFAQEGKPIAPVDTVLRRRGTITMDNERYKRYSGEVQIMKEDYPYDERVNVIGYVPEEYLLLLDIIGNGEQFMFVKMK